jgi:hypothetical protein
VGGKKGKADSASWKLHTKVGRRRGGCSLTIFVRAGANFHERKCHWWLDARSMDHRSLSRGFLVLPHVFPPDKREK